MAEMVTMTGNDAAAHIAYKTNEVIAIYPITPSTPMGEVCDAWSAKGLKNLWGVVPMIQEMQSEGGVAGTCHGALQAGALTTTFTASQGLLLMIPNMYKIAGELTSTVFHVAARSLATHGLSIFGDHGDVMAARMTGWGILFSNSVQEAMDFALIAQAATLESRIPFMHAFDGFRTSHEMMKIEIVDDAHIRAMIPADAVAAHRSRSLTPDRPVMRGTAQNPDVFFQSREAANPFYQAAPGHVERAMERFAGLTGRKYRLFDYVGAKDAERVVIAMGSGCEAVEEAVTYLVARGEKIGLVKIRLYRPFHVEAFLASLPSTVKAVAVLDRTKEPGGAGDPLYTDVVTALAQGVAAGKAPFKAFPKVIGGRYGLSSKEFTPAMAKAVFDELSRREPKNPFTVGITDDVTHTSLDYDPGFDVEPDDVYRAVFWGLGSDGTVGANKNSISIIGDRSTRHVQAYFVYDSKKSGSVTVSHLRFGPEPIRSSYLIRSAHFIGVHQFGFLSKFPVLADALPGATVLVNSPYDPDETWRRLPGDAQKTILAKKIKLYVVDAYHIASAEGMGGRINTIMQTAFFATSGVLPVDEAVAEIKNSIRKTYGKRGEAVVRQNDAVVDKALSAVRPVDLAGKKITPSAIEQTVPADAPKFVRDVTAMMIAGRGEELPVSAMPVDGTYPTGTTRWEKRGITLEVPVWEKDLCIQCGKCVMVCPHAVIRSKIYEPARLAGAPGAFQSADAKWVEKKGQKYTLQVSGADCTGCALCVEACPVKDKSNVGRKAINMRSIEPIREAETANWEFFLGLPDNPGGGTLPSDTVKNAQLRQPLFEFPGACAGCGETPYLRLVSQLFGDRALIANATGCSSIYGGNLPTTPWTKNAEGRGPAWSNSLFEDNAEFGLGFRLTMDQQAAYARSLVTRLENVIGPALAKEVLEAQQHDEASIDSQRLRVARLKERVAKAGGAEAKDLLAVADTLVRKSVWIIGGDGWAYDIGFGGLDHVLSQSHDVNVLVLDTEVYSNTGGQASKATPRGAVAKFAAAGKRARKKDLGRMIMNYGNVYVAQIAMGANDAHTLKVLREAEAYDGPSLVIAYSHCIAHGIDMSKGMRQQKLAVESGYWPLYRYNPALAAVGMNPFTLDSKAPTVPLKDYVYNEARYRMLQQSDPRTAELLLRAAEEDAAERWAFYERLAAGHGELPADAVARQSGRV